MRYLHIVANSWTSSDKGKIFSFKIHVCLRSYFLAAINQSEAENQHFEHRPCVLTE